MIIEKTLFVIRPPNKYCLSYDNHDCICRCLVREIFKVLRAKKSLRQRGIKNFAWYKRKISQLYHAQTFTDCNKVIIQQINVISWYNPNEYLYIYHYVYRDLYRMTFLWPAVVWGIGLMRDWSNAYVDLLEYPSPVKFADRNFDRNKQCDRIRMTGKDSIRSRRFSRVLQICSWVFALIYFKTDQAWPSSYHPQYLCIGWGHFSFCAFLSLLTCQWSNSSVFHRQTDVLRWIVSPFPAIPQVPLWWLRSVPVGPSGIGSWRNPDGTEGSSLDPTEYEAIWRWNSPICCRFGFHKSPWFSTFLA